MKENSKNVLNSHTGKQKYNNGALHGKNIKCKTIFEVIFLHVCLRTEAKQKKKKQF